MLAPAFFLLTEVHGFTLNDLTLGGADDWVLHAKRVAIDVKEDGGRRLKNTWHQ